MSLLKYHGAKLVNVITTKLKMSSSALDVVLMYMSANCYINPFLFQLLLIKSTVASQSADNKTFSNGQSRETYHAKT